MQTMTINATVDPRAAEVGFNKVAASANITANKISASMARARSALATTSQSMAGVAKAFVTIELGKRAISGLIELAKQSEYNKRLMDDMNKSTGALAKTLSDQMSPAVEFWTGKIKTLAEEWNSLLSTGQTGRTNDPEFEKARDLRIKYDELQASAKGLSGLQKEGAEIQLRDLQRQIDKQDELLARLSKGASIQAANAEKAKRQEEEVAKAKEKAANTPSEKQGGPKEFDATALQDKVNQKRKDAQEDLRLSRENEAELVRQDNEKAKADMQAQSDAEVDAMRRTMRLEQSKTNMRKAATEANIEYAKMNMQAGINGLQASRMIFGENKKLQTAEAALSMGVGMMNAIATKPFLPLGLSQFALASAIGIKTMSQINSVKPAATGADFETNGPQLMLVGENAGGRERVQVTPLSSPNINGPKGNNGGQGMITFQPIIYMTGDVARDEAYSDRALRSFGRKVQEARRMGYI
jgi:hypothetical protein